MTQKVKKRPLRGFLTYSSDYQTLLFEFDFCANFFELSLEGFCIGLGNAFFEVGGSAVDELFSFFEAQTGEFFHQLNHFQLFSTCVLENDVEGGLLFYSGTSGGTGSYGYCCCRKPTQRIRLRLHC